MARENVPQFGNWESEDNVPCTVYFDKAKKNKGGKIVNPNDPQENSVMFPAQTKRPRSRRSVESDELPKRVAPKSSSQSQLSKEDSGEYRHSATSAHGNHTGTRGGVVNESSHGGQSGRRVGGRSTRRPRPPSVVSDCSIDWSPYNIDRFLTPSRLCLVREYGYNDFSMVNHRGTNPVSEDSPPSNISQQSNKDSKAKGGCLPFHFPFAGPKKKRT